MNVAKTLRDHYLRIDARSLGLFRLGFGLVLIADLFRRWAWLRDFYSNDGVLPNHNHLFNLKEVGRVWSVLHAFSSVDENRFAFGVILLAYLGFLVGYQTRVFHVLSLVCLVSLASRNILLEGAGTSAAIAVLFFSAFLPCGSRFSVDALRASLAARDEKDAAALNDRAFLLVRAGEPPDAGEGRVELAPDRELLEARRLPGWTPISLAALALLLQLLLIHLVSALQQSGETWRQGTALYYALHSELWVSPLGVAARALPPSVLAALTYALKGVEYAVPALILLPVARRPARFTAAALVLFHGLLHGALFTFGLYGWTLCAAAALLVPTESWDRLLGAPRAGRMRTVVYDADCGVCLWLCRVLGRLDLRSHLTFQGNDDLRSLLTRKLGPGGAAGKVVKRAPPAEVTAELAAETVVVVDGDGNVFTRGRAVAEVLQALPFGWLFSWVLRVPGLAQAADAAYSVVAARRQAISVAMGKEACGVPAPGEPLAAEELDAEVAPALQRARSLTAALREAGAAVLLLATVVQTSQANDLPRGGPLPQSVALAAVVAWPRMLARWDVLADPPTEDARVVLDAQTRGGRSVDLLTGAAPEFDPSARRGTGLGPLWNQFLGVIRLPDTVVFPSRAHPVQVKNEFQRAFKDYTAKGGPRWSEPIGDSVIVGLDAYWVTKPIPPPGQPASEAPPGRERIFNLLRGGLNGSIAPMVPISPSFRPQTVRQ